MLHAYVLSLFLSAWATDPLRDRASVQPVRRLTLRMWWSCQSSCIRLCRRLPRLARSASTVVFLAHSPFGPAHRPPAAHGCGGAPATPPSVPRCPLPKLLCPPAPPHPTTQTPLTRWRVQPLAEPLADNTAAPPPPCRTARPLPLPQPEMKMTSKSKLAMAALFAR
jgi:hypothetical protein